MRVTDVVQQQPEEPLLRWGLSVALTTGVWTLFGWLLATLVTLILWAFGVTTAYAALVVDAAGVDVALLVQVLLAAVLLAAVLVLWAQLQRHRFVGKERRQRPDDVTAQEAAAALGASPRVAAALHAWQVLVVDLDDDGRPVAVRPGSAVRPGAAGAPGVAVERGVGPVPGAGTGPAVPLQRGPHAQRPQPDGQGHAVPAAPHR